MAGPTESLFSLEVVVDCVEKSLVSCRFPAIAFRLLDFPTLIIRSEEKESRQYLNGFYPIQSGKSCLFKMSKEMLLSRLQTTPLYIMLVDISPNKSKLLASTTISLTNCFENVFESIQQNGLDVPAVHGGQGLFELYNLMGTQVASVKLTYRVFSLGGTINGHVQQCISSAENLKKRDDSQRKELDDLDPKKKVQTSKQIIEDFGVKGSEDEKDSRSGKETEMFPSSLQREVETQTNICGKDDIIFPRSTVDLKENVNVTRPPPLYYNSQSTIAPSKIPLQRYRISSSEKNINKVFKQIPEKTYKTVAIQTSCSEQRNTEVVDISRIGNDERAQLADLPLINALLSELSLAKQSWMNNAAAHTNNNRVQPEPITTHTKDTIPVLVLQPNKSLKQKEKVDVSSNRKPRPVKPVTKGVLIKRNYQYTKFTKSSLKCGTTKTQKLREALNKKKVHNNNLSLCNIDEEKRLRVNSLGLKENEKNKLVVSEKETREFGCQVHVAVTCSDEQGPSSENENKSMQLKTILDEQLYNNIVEKNENLLPGSGQTDSEDIVPSSSKYHSFKGVIITDDLSQDDHDDINTLLNPTLQEEPPLKSDLELSSHSKKSSSSALTISQQSAKPTFSHFSPTRAKNVRYSNDECSNKAKSSDGSASSGGDGLVSRPINQLSLNSSFEHNYSDNFDSLASEQSDN